jgi:tartrate dehydrogenase/decarboxylase/D-malate dehydrogenase
VSASHRVAVIPGDGVGPEVTAEAVKALNALAVPLELTELQWGSQHWLERGTMMERDGIERLRSFDAVLFGACGDPRVPDPDSLWGLILALRRGLDLWANIRPVKLLEGIPCPLLGRNPGVKGANIRVGSPFREGWEDRGHGSLLSLPRF